MDEEPEETAGDGLRVKPRCLTGESVRVGDDLHAFTEQEAPEINVLAACARPSGGRLPARERSRHRLPP